MFVNFNYKHCAFCCYMNMLNTTDSLQINSYSAIVKILLLYTKNGLYYIIRIIIQHKRK